MTKVSFTTKSGKRVSFTTKSSKTRKKKGSGQKTRKPKRSRAGKSNKQPRSRSRSVAKKKGSSRRPGKKSFIDRIPVLRNKTVQKVGFGLGMGVIVADIIQLAARFAPPQISQPLQQNANLIKLGVELATEPLSAVVDVALNPRQLTGITNRFNNSGGTSHNSNSNGNVVGFA